MYTSNNTDGYTKGILTTIEQLTFLKQSLALRGLNEEKALSYMQLLKI